MTVTRTIPDLSYLFNHTSHVLKTHMTAALDEIGLTPRMHCVLVHALEEERTQIQLAEVCDMDKTTMVVTLDALEKAGYAERRPSSRDRRARIVSVTERGAEIAERSMRIVDRVHGAVLEALPEDEREVFVRAMERLAGGHLAEPVDASCRRPRERTAAI
ncbi:MarR family winged helix-turn-helix transcriptional regulator [Actinomadura keratinilytica]|jgi:DNA-binding MarR family transcriptional regulator|uniref:HTH marR-type domain-containing protein n=1 Tax=Actinomadura keratinilytica TaxID=547461 RepID=A0ABP7Y6I9_9ACTN